MVIYKRGQTFELGKPRKKSSKWPEPELNPGPPDCESDALISRPRYVLSSMTLTLMKTYGSLLRGISRQQTIFLSDMRFLVQWFDVQSICDCSLFKQVRSCRACASLRSNPPFCFVPGM